MPKNLPRYFQFKTIKTYELENDSHSYFECSFLNLYIYIVLCMHTTCTNFVNISILIPGSIKKIQFLRPPKTFQEFLYWANVKLSDFYIYRCESRFILPTVKYQKLGHILQDCFSELSHALYTYCKCLKVDTHVMTSCFIYLTLTC